MTTLRELRLAAGLTQQQLAAAAGVSLRTIHGLEKGETHGRVKTRRLILQALGVPYSEHKAIFGPVRSQLLRTFAPELPVA